MIIKNSNTPVRKFDFKGTSYDLTKGPVIKQLHNKLRDNFLRTVINVPAIKQSVNRNILEHTTISNFYINPEFLKFVSQEYGWNKIGDVNMIIRCAIYDGIPSNTYRTGINRYIYHPDKPEYLRARVEFQNIDENIVDSLDIHHCGKCTNGNTNNYRHFGTPMGKALYNKRIYYKNLSLLRYIFNGSEDVEFVCASTAAPLEHVGYKGFDEDLRITNSYSPFHHVLLVDNVSVRKMDGNLPIALSPFKIITRKKLWKEANKQYLLDIMSCIPLTGHQHQSCHTLPYSDITMHTNLKAKPLHMRSRQHFERVAKMYNLGVTYDEFMYSLTFESVGLDSKDIIKQMKELVANSRYTKPLY